MRAASVGSGGAKPKRRKLSDVVQIIGGGTPSKRTAAFWGGTVPWVSPKDMKSDVISTSEDKITREAIENSATKWVPRNATLVVVRSGILARTVPICIAGCDLTINQDLKALVPDEAVNPRYLFLFLKSRESELLASVTSSATVHRITTVTLESLEIPLPSLDEQQRIVAILDQAFAALDRARANAEANLADAFEIENSLISSVIDHATSGAVESVALGTLCKIARGGSPRPIKKFLTTDESGINWIKISDATASGKFVDSTKERIVREGVSRSRFVTSGSFLLTNSMSFGRPYILRTDGCIHDGWLVLEPDYGRVDQDYLYYLLGSRQVFREFDRLAAGSTVRNLNINLVSSVVVKLPSLEKQRKAVEVIETGVERCASLGGNYRRQLADTDALRQSLLQQAFSGQLT